MSFVNYQDWKHVFKLDPDKPVTDEALERLCMSGTDAIVVGGTTGVTFDNTVDLLARIRQYELPCVLEISNQEAIVPGFDYFFSYRWFSMLRTRIGLSASITAPSKNMGLYSIGA